MKLFRPLLTVLCLAVSTAAFAHEKTVSFKVWGNCGMCEKTIEKAAKLPGVASADWDEETKQITVTYDTHQTDPDAVQKSIAAAGYDTEAYKADDKAYQNLHGCCKYDRKASK